MQEGLFMVSCLWLVDRQEEGVANSRVYVYMCVCTYAIHQTLISTCLFQCCV